MWHDTQLLIQHLVDLSFGRFADRRLDTAMGSKLALAVGMKVSDVLADSLRIHQFFASGVEPSVVL